MVTRVRSQVCTCRSALTAFQEHLHWRHLYNSPQERPCYALVVRHTRVSRDHSVNVHSVGKIGKGEMPGEGELVAVLVKPATEVWYVNGNDQSSASGGWRCERDRNHDHSTYLQPV